MTAPIWLRESPVVSGRILFFSAKFVDSPQLKQVQIIKGDYPSLSYIIDNEPEILCEKDSWAHALVNAAIEGNTHHHNREFELVLKEDGQYIYVDNTETNNRFRLQNADDIAAMRADPFFRRLYDGEVDIWKLNPVEDYEPNRSQILSQACQKEEHKGNKGLVTPLNTSLSKQNNVSETAIDFYERINYLIKTSKQGFTDYSVQVGSICTLLVPGKPNDHRSDYEKETAKLIDWLSSLEDLPEIFFEKPFYCPFDEQQLKELKAQCWVKDPQDKGYQVEHKLITLYENILVKQEQVVEHLLSEKEYSCKLTLENRIATLEQAITKIQKQKNELDKKAKNPHFFENKVYAEDKFKVLDTLEDTLQKIQDEYDEMLHSELDPELNLFNYFQTTEKAIHDAFKIEGPALKALKSHSNILMKMLDDLLDFITFGFAHISTDTESLINDSNLSINNRF